jgi:4-hydroxybenzoate polyprenyltransferase
VTQASSIRETERAQEILPAWRALLRAMRPPQWIKNLFVLAPLLFAHSLFSAEDVLRALAAFGLFCLASSSVYLLNDLRDLEQDRMHPTKRERPLAAGQLAPRTAWIALSGLLAASVAGALVLRPAFALVLLGYWGVNLLYSLHFKHFVILDVFAIAAGFVLRVIGGAVAIAVQMSNWLLVCTTLLALFLGFAKRRHELLTLEHEAANHRKVLAEYNERFLDMMIGVVTASTVMSYALYTVSEETVAKFETEKLLWTLPFVLYGVFRYLYLMYHKAEGGDPTVLLYSDRPLLVTLLLWAATSAAIIYL